jgi:hypothetical protein
MMAELADAAVIRLLLLPNREKKRKETKNENNKNLDDNFKIHQRAAYRIPLKVTLCARR